MAISALRWFKAALVLQILLLGYWIAIEVLVLFPWNDIAARPVGDELGKRMALFALPQLAFMLVFAFGIQTAGVLSAIGYAALLGSQLWIWWEPVVLGPDIGQQALHGQLYAQTIGVPFIEDLPMAPDAQYVTLHALILVTFIVTSIAVARLDRL